MVKLRHTSLAAFALASLVGSGVQAQDTAQDPVERGTDKAQQGASDVEQGAGDKRQQGSDKMQQGADKAQQGAQQMGSEAEDAKSQARQQGEKYKGKGESKSKSLGARMHSQSVELSALDRSQIQRLQEKLRELGVYEGKADGDAGPRTKRALKKYYGAQAKLAAKGRISPEGAQSLGMDASEIERVRGQEAPERETLRGEGQDQGQAQPQGTSGEQETTEPKTQGGEQTAPMEGETHDEPSGTQESAP